MTLPIDIRPAMTSDIDGLIALLKDLFSREQDFEFDEHKQRKGLERMLADCRKHRMIMVAQIDKTVVGMVSAQILVSTAEGGTVALLEDMVVAKACRREKIGTALLDAIEDWVGLHDGKRLQLLADKDNLEALAFYASQSWQRTNLICLRKLIGPKD